MRDAPGQDLSCQDKKGMTGRHSHVVLGPWKQGTGPSMTDDVPIFGGAVERLPLMSWSRPRLESPTSVWPSALELPLMGLQFAERRRAGRGSRPRTSRDHAIGLRSEMVARKPDLWFGGSKDARAATNSHHLIMLDCRSERGTHCMRLPQSSRRPALSVA